jgi:hypothetical protein
MAFIIKDFGGPLTTYASLYIAHNNMSPDDISGILQLQPTDKQVKGDIICLPSKKIKVAAISYWKLSTESLVQSEYMEPHLDWLIQQLLPVKDQIISLQKIPDILMRLRCIWCSGEENNGINFTAEQIKRLAELNMDCSFGLYFDSDS